MNFLVINVQNKKIQEQQQQMAPHPVMAVSVSQPLPPMPGGPPLIPPPGQVTPWQSTAPPLLPTTTGPLQETASIQQVCSELVKRDVSIHANPV